MTEVIITYKIRSYVRGLIAAYFQSIDGHVYVCSHKAGFIKRFNKKLFSVCTDKDSFIILRKEINYKGYSIQYVNTPHETLSLDGVVFSSVSK